MQKSVTINPDFVKQESIPDGSNSASSHSDDPVLSDSDLGEFALTTKHCVGLAFNIKGEYGRFNLLVMRCQEVMSVFNASIRSDAKRFCLCS